MTGSSRLPFEVECEGHLAVAGLLGLDDVLVVVLRLRIGLLLRLQRVDDVLDRDRTAILEAGLGPDLEGDRGEIGGIGDPLADQAVLRRGLVRAVDHQRIVEQAKIGCLLAFEAERVEAVERAFGELPKRATLGRVRVHPIEVLEARPVFRFAHQRQSDVLGVRRQRGRTAASQESCKSGAGEATMTGHAGSCPPANQERGQKRGHTAEITMQGRERTAKLILGHPQTTGETSDKSDDWRR